MYIHCTIHFQSNYQFTKFNELICAYELYYSITIYKTCILIIQYYHGKHWFIMNKFSFFFKNVRIFVILISCLGGSSNQVTTVLFWWKPLPCYIYIRIVILYNASLLQDNKQKHLIHNECHIYWQLYKIPKSDLFCLYMKIHCITQGNKYK